MELRKWIVVPLIVLVSTACSSTKKPPSATSTGATSSSVHVLAAPDCLESPCGGSLDVGLHRSTLFDPAVEFEITSPGWSWDYYGDSRSGNFRLIADESHELPYAADGIYFWFDPAIASSNCEEVEEPLVGRSVDELVEWLAAAPGLVMSEPVHVTVGGLDGVRLDLRLDPTWKETCAYSESSPPFR